MDLWQANIPRPLSGLANHLPEHSPNPSATEPGSTRADSLASLLDLVEGLRGTVIRELDVLGRDELLTVASAISEVTAIANNAANALAPVNRLPAELLAIILKYAAEYDERIAFTKAGYPRLPEKVRYRDVINLTHVCSRWRSVSLALPALWTRVDDDNNVRLDTFLARCGSMPLAVVVSSTPCSASYLKASLQSNGLRARRLDINLDYVGMSIEFDGSALECFTLTATLPDGENSDEVIYSILTQGAPRLKALALNIFMSAWTPRGITFAALTHFYLRQDFSTVQPDTLTQTLTSLLGNMPLLESAHFCSSPPAESSMFNWAQYPQSRYTVLFPLLHLRRLVFVDWDAIDAFRFLSLLQMSEDVFVRVDTSSPIGWPSVNNLQAVTFLDSASRLEIVDINQVFRIVAETPKRAGLWMQTQGPGHIDKVLFSLLPDSLLATVHTLHICTEDAVDLLQCLLHMPSLATLNVLTPLGSSGDYSAALLSLLTCRYSQDPSSPICPKLVSLGIQATTWEWELEDIPGTPAVKMAASRARMGRPLDRFTFHAPDFLYGSDSESENEDSRREAGYRVLCRVFKRVKKYVRVLDLGPDGDVCPFVMSAEWENPEVEKYWHVPPEDQPRYRALEP
ncbi:hypothetical protein C8Q79DRAFT_1014629 [Trametes meyenii]|nr:hypothetical protein C8Q79DRAFT_1014629 [Trametes meyenii]